VFCSKTLQSEYPIVCAFGNTTLHLSEAPSIQARQALEQLIKKRRARKLTRASAPLSSCETPLFAKVQPLDTFKAKVRVSLNKPQRNGRFDWPLEELMNSLEAQRRGVEMPALKGYGYTRSRLGLTEEFFLLTHLLEGHMDGAECIRRNPENIETFILDAFQLLSSLASKNITHMDFWVGNIMVPEQTHRPLKAIDFENCFAGPTAHPSETLGFQLGFFYRRDIYKFITEAAYDRLVDQYLSALPGLSRDRFEAVYQLSKHEYVGRKQRREVFLSGRLITG
jgi:hypothetical protein